LPLKEQVLYFQQVIFALIIQWDISAPLFKPFFTSTKPQFLDILPYKTIRLAVLFFFGTGIAALL